MERVANPYIDFTLIPDEFIDNIFPDEEEPGLYDADPDNDPYTEQFQLNETIYHVSLETPCKGTVTNINNDYNPGLKSRALITITTESGEHITDYQSNFSYFLPGWMRDVI